ncbi:MAG: hypothetical protein WC654_05015 [Patescibacteria group bacterium]
MLKLLTRLIALKCRFSDHTKRKCPRRFGRVGRVGIVFVLLFLSFSFVSITHAAKHAPAPVGADAPVFDVMDSLFKTLADIAFTVAGTLTQGIVLMIDILIPIMTYNSFVTNPVVSAGWAIMRDTVNMFFVIVLIIIAFGTIFGHQKFQWSQQVPKLLLFAIVINFSKTLSGIMIDFGQVIMLTFANALREIAAGNFIQLLGLNKLYQLSQSTDAITSVKAAGGKALESADLLGAGIMAVMLTMWVLGTLIMMVVILVYRIIGLWVLVVLAPLAWFVGGAGGSSGIIQSDAYSKWWDRFKCLVGVGPVLTFFLWLTLATVGAGQGVSDFDVSTSNAADISSTLFEPKNFMSFIIGMAMLFAGFDAAQQLCSSLSGGVLGKSLQRARSGALQKGALALGLKGTGAGLRLGAKAAYRAPGAAVSVAKYIPGSKAVSGAYGRARESVKTEMGRAVQKFGKATGLRAVERVGVGYTASAKAQAGIARTEEMKKAQEGMKGKSREEKLDLMKTYANQVGRGGSLSVKEDAQYKALLDETMGDKRMQKEARANGVLQKAWEQKGNEYQNDNRHDASKLDQINDFKKANADFTKSSNLISNWDDVKGLNDDALKDEAVRDRLKNVKSDVRGADGVYMSAYDAVSQGLGGAGEKKQKALTTEAGERYERMKDQELARVNVNTIGREGTADGIRKAIEAAMRAGDESRVRMLMSHLGARTTGAKDSGERMQMLGAMREAASFVRGMPHSQGTTDHFNRMTRGADETVKRELPKVEAERDRARDAALDPQRDRLKAELDKLVGDLAAARAAVSASLQVSATRSQQASERAQADPMNSASDKVAAKVSADEAKAAALPENVDKAPTVVNILNQITAKEAQRTNPVIDPATDAGKDFAKVEAELNALKAYLESRNNNP